MLSVENFRAVQKRPLSWFGIPKMQFGAACVAGFLVFDRMPHERVISAIGIGVAVTGVMVCFFRYLEVKSPHWAEYRYGLKTKFPLKRYYPRG